MSSLTAGTYRILNVKSGTALTVSDGGEGHVFCWQRHGGKVQQWLVQRSGERYRFQNRGTNQYLTVPNPENATEIYAGRHPTSWDLDQSEHDHGTYMMRFHDYNRILEVDGWGAGYNGNKAHMTLHLEWMPHRSWSFERLGDEPGEEDQRLHKQIADRDHRLVEKDQKLMEKDRRLAEMAERIVALEQGPADGGQEAQSTRRTHVREHDGPTVNHTQDNLTEQLAQAQEFLRSAHETIRERDITILTLQNQLLQQRVDNEMSRQARVLVALEDKVNGIQGRLDEENPRTQNAS